VLNLLQSPTLLHLLLLHDGLYQADTLSSGPCCCCCCCACF